MGENLENNKEEEKKVNSEEPENYLATPTSNNIPLYLKKRIEFEKGITLPEKINPLHFRVKPFFLRFIVYLKPHTVSANF